jgi:formate--tetrahydrofolate ligase
VVIVATVRALKMNGGVGPDDLGAENVEAVTEGLRQPRPPHREREEVRRAGRGGDQPLHHRHRRRDPGGQGLCASRLGAEAILCSTGPRARKARGAGEQGRRDGESGAAQFAPLYEDDLGLFEKIETIAKRIYRADERDRGQEDPRPAEASGKTQGYGNLPVCMAKTQYSVLDRPEPARRADGLHIPVREVRLSAGAGFVVAICGEIMTMPGLPRVPSA